ncbi:MAG: hypothetical protein OXD46_05260 [Chloroflexi bacterium]|nr:hypothetical protein [Chloroflexota bacterium]
MLYQAIRKACEKYHSYGYGIDYATALACYRDAFTRRRKGDSPDRPSHEEAWILLSFANGWNARMRASFEDIHSSLIKIEPDLEKLRGKTILDVCLDERIDGNSARFLIKRCFATLKESGGGSAVVGPSKILHIINPDLYVMWDTAIIEKYGCGKYILYTDFLRKMQSLANQVVCEVMEQDESHSRETAIASLTGCRHTLAKALDEYNYVNFTLPRLQGQKT